MNIKNAKKIEVWQFEDEMGDVYICNGISIFEEYFDDQFKREFFIKHFAELEKPKQLEKNQFLKIPKFLTYGNKIQDDINYELLEKIDKLEEKISDISKKCFETILTLEKRIEAVEPDINKDVAISNQLFQIVKDQEKIYVTISELGRCIKRTNEAVITLQKEKIPIDSRLPI